MRQFVVYFLAFLGLVTAPFAIYYGEFDAIAASSLALMLPFIERLAQRRGW